MKTEVIIEISRILKELLSEAMSGNNSCLTLESKLAKNIVSEMSVHGFIIECLNEKQLYIDMSNIGYISVGEGIIDTLFVLTIDGKAVNYTRKQY